MLDSVSAIPSGEIPAGTTKPDYNNSSLADALLRTAYKDRDAFRLVYSLTSSALFNVCFRVCRDRSAAEDVLADVYITIWKRAGTWTPERGSAIAWLSRIARNRAIDWQRARARRGIQVDDCAWHVPDGAPNAEALLLKAETETRVRRSLGALTFEQQSAIRAAFFDGHSYAELAARRGVPLVNIQLGGRDDGIELARRLKELNIPVLLISGQVSRA